jgi:hypothetical protein
VPLLSPSPFHLSLTSPYHGYFGTFNGGGATIESQTTFIPSLDASTPKGELRKVFPGTSQGNVYVVVYVEEEQKSRVSGDYRWGREYFCSGI